MSENENTHRFTPNNTKKTSNWKIPGSDGIHGFWVKKFTSIHDREALEMNRCLQGAHAPLKQLQTGNLPTDVVENINSTNKGRGLLLANKPRTVPEVQKRCCKGSKGTAELLYINQDIINESNTKLKNLVMAWINYKNTYDMVPQSWIIDCHKMYKISDEVLNFIKKNHEN